MLYIFPLIFAVGGINFPVGVLIYWFTSNLWTMGQQFYVIRRNPAPGTPAYEAWEDPAQGEGPRQAAGARTGPGHQRLPSGRAGVRGGEHGDRGRTGARGAPAAP